MTTLNRIASLDGVRALAALLVMVFHFVGLFGRESPGWVRQASVLGQTGVDLFFILSGFLITRILLETAGKDGYYRAFYARRVLRIFPLYFAFLGLYFFVLPFILGSKIPSANSQLLSWLFLENVGQTFPVLGDAGPPHYWSLAVEEHFYLAWPFIVASFGKRTLLRIIACVLLLSPILRFVVENQGYSSFFLTPTRLDGLSFGAAIAILLASPQDNSGWLLPLSRTLFLFLPVLLLPMFIMLSGSGYALLQAVKLSLIPMFYASFIVLCLIDEKISPVRQVLEARWFRWIGSISFGLYVFHPSCFKIVAKFLPGTPLPVSAAVAFGLTFLIAWASFEWFEKSFLFLKRYFVAQSRPKNEILNPEN